MILIELIFVTCLAREPGTCHEESHLFAEPISIMGCMMAAQPYMAAWSETHPDWVVRSWSCGPAGGEALDA